MLAAGTQSQELKEAGGYELPNNCTDPLGQGSLRTKQVVSLDNKVSTTICLPPFSSSLLDPGIAATIVENDSSAGSLGAASVSRDVDGLHRRPR